MKKNRGKTKEELKREKQLNRSLLAPAKALRDDFNIQAFQKEDCIIKNGEKSYVCVFSLKYREKSSFDFNSLTSLLCANLAQRFRISSFSQRVNGVLKDLYYLSIFFQADEYYIVHDAVVKFREEFVPLLTKYGFQIETLALSDIFIIWNLNMNFQMISLETESILESRRKQSYLKKPEIKKKERLIFDYKDCYCVALKLMSVEQESKSFPFECLSCFYKVYFAVDTWKLTDEDMKIFNRIMRTSFYPYKEHETDEKDEIVNFSFVLIVMEQNKGKLLTNLKMLHQSCEEYGYIMVPCFDEEADCFFSLSSFGIMNYSNTHTAKLKQITHFYKEKSNYGID